MSGVKERLDYLNETKSQLRQAINETGGELLENSPLSDYPGQIQYIVDTTIIPQSELDSLTGEVVDING